MHTFLWQPVQDAFPQGQKYGIKSCLSMPQRSHLAWNWHLSRPPVYCLEWQQTPTSGLLAWAASKRMNESPWNCAVRWLFDLFNSKTDRAGLSLYIKHKKTPGNVETRFRIKQGIWITSALLHQLLLRWLTLKTILIPVQYSKTGSHLVTISKSRFNMKYQHKIFLF